jgi:hypothetical protein
MEESIAIGIKCYLMKLMSVIGQHGIRFIPLKEARKMTLPSFSAEASIYRSTVLYATQYIWISTATAMDAIPQQFDLRARLGEFGELRVERFIDLPERLCRCECEKLLITCNWTCVENHVDDGLSTIDARQRCREEGLCYSRYLRCEEECNPWRIRS